MSEGYEKSQKKIKKPLDKPQRMCYNKTVNKGAEPIKTEKEVHTMTTREFFLAVVDFADTAAATDDTMTFGPTKLHPSELSSTATQLIQKLDAKNAKRASTESKEKKEAAARRNAVLEFLQAHKGEVFTRDAIAEATGVSPAAVSSAVKALGEQVNKTEIKVDKVKRVAYTIPADNDEDEGE